ncbi:Crp/Fnr family transcriptional regulator [uncultured Maribacter sp.]|uniref:Crp/Fnr family transcriptional regulator n=1 Tax=uncultured Maribacter sp. TaxID=431308 RepID=UPI002604B7D6|nr:Crp/Fnr family transcriptional regulator [uncultured Maribacter sp.]
MKTDSNNLKIIPYIKSLINVDDNVLNESISRCTIKHFKKKETISKSGNTDRELFFIEDGFIRLFITDSKGKQHTTHFAIPNVFIADYTALASGLPAMYTLEAIEDTKMIVISNENLQYLYSNLKEGELLGRKILNQYFYYFDNRLQHFYTHTPQERFDLMNSIFPDIHNKVPQHMIASYINITSVHLSRLKKQAHLKT